MIRIKGSSVYSSEKKANSKYNLKNMILQVDNRTLKKMIIFKGLCFLKGKMASTEVLAVAIWDEIASDILSLGAELHSIKLYETENNFVEYFGPNK